MSIKRKILSRIGLGAGTLGAILALAAAFSAFESHIINVTARIENALNVPTEALAFGTVFPQEYLTRDIQVGLSDSFLSENRVDDVTYTIKQKPKVKDPICATQVSASSTDPCNDSPIPGDPYATITVGGFTGPAWQYCENNLPPDSDTTDSIGYTVNLADPYWQHCYLPLANSLSKDKAADELSDGLPTDADTVDVQVPAFHQAYVWASGTNTSSLDPAFLAHGKLMKSGNDTEDTWVIDLKVPCFHNMCAQEASDPTNDVNDNTPGFFVPDAFRLDPKTEHKVFGTDLWIEVTGVSLPPTTTEPTTLTVTKVVINDNQGTSTTTDFSFMVDGGPAVPFEADGTNVINATSGPHTVAEPAVAGYTATFSGDCDATGNITVPASGNATCTITNNDNPPLVGTLVINKVVVNDNGGTATVSDFSLFANGTAMLSGVPQDFAPGSFAVSENGIFGYSASFSGDCNASGNVTVSASATSTCTITNNDIPPVITVTKAVVGGTAVPDDFDPSIDGLVKTSGSSNQVSANAPHTLNEEATVPNYTFTSLTGTSFLGVPCPAALNGTITLAPGDVVTCTITNTFSTPPGT